MPLESVAAYLAVPLAIVEQLVVERAFPLLRIGPTRRVRRSDLEAYRGGSRSPGGLGEAGQRQSGWNKLLPAVDVVRGAGHGAVDHEVHREGRDVLRSDHPPDGQH